MDSSTIASKAFHRFPAFTHKDFRIFWLGQGVSLIGTWVQRTAQQWLVYSLTNSAFALGVLGVAQFGPILLFSLFAGVFIDRFPKRQILLIIMAVQMVQAFILSFVVLTGQVRYWHVLILAIVLGLANTFEMPARQSMIIELAGKKDLTNAIALNSSLVNLVSIISPAISALFIERFSIGLCFLVNAISFIPVLTSLFFIKPLAAPTGGQQESVLKSIHGGLQHVVKKPVLLTAALAMVVVGTFAMNINFIFPVYSDLVLHHGVKGYGFLLSARGVGSFVGAMMFAATTLMKPSRGLLFFSALLTSLFVILLGFVDLFPLALLVAAFQGYFNMTFMTTVNSSLQLNAGEGYRGRVMSIYALTLGGTVPFGSFLAGTLTENLGPSDGFLISGLISALLTLIIFALVRQKKAAASET